MLAADAQAESRTAAGEVAAGLAEAGGPMQLTRTPAAANPSPGAGQAAGVLAPGGVVAGVAAHPPVPAQRMPGATLPP